MTPTEPKLEHAWIALEITRLRKIKAMHENKHSLKKFIIIYIMKIF